MLMTIRGFDGVERVCFCWLVRFVAFVDDCFQIAGEKIHVHATPAAWKPAFLAHIQSLLAQAGG